MRKIVEPTARNLLRKPLVLGVPLAGLMGLSGLVLAVFVVFGARPAGSIVSLSIGLGGYIGLRVLSRFARPGWEEALIFALERRIRRNDLEGSIRKEDPGLTVSAPDTAASRSWWKFQMGFPG
jgi:hypothetical protein